MPADEAPHAVAARIAAGLHGLALEVALDVVPQLRRALVARRRFAAHGLEHDRIQVAVQASRRHGAVGTGHFAGRQRFGFQPAPHRRRQRQALQAPGRGAHQQFVKQQAQRVHVGGHGDRAAFDLLGRGVVGRQQGLRLRGRAAVGYQAGDAEVEQLGVAVVGDQDVGGLEVAVHHQVAVRVVHGHADFAEQLQAAVEVEPALARPGHDVAAVHVLHRHEGAAVGRQAAIHQTGDAGMFQPGQDATLVAEVRHVPGRFRADQLERHVLFKIGVGAVRQVDLAHAAAADQPFDAEVADAVAGRQ